MRGLRAPAQGTGPPGTNLTDQPTAVSCTAPQRVTEEPLCKSDYYVSTLLGAKRKTKKTVFASKQLTNNCIIQGRMCLSSTRDYKHQFVGDSRHEDHSFEAQCVNTDRRTSNGLKLAFLCLQSKDWAVSLPYMPGTLHVLIYFRLTSVRQVLLISLTLQRRKQRVRKVK